MIAKEIEKYIHTKIVQLTVENIINIDPNENSEWTDYDQLKLVKENIRRILDIKNFFYLGFDSQKD